MSVPRIGDMPMVSYNPAWDGPLIPPEQWRAAARNLEAGKCDNRYTFTHDSKPSCVDVICVTLTNMPTDTKENSTPAQSDSGRMTTVITAEKFHAHAIKAIKERPGESWQDVLAILKHLNVEGDGDWSAAFALARRAWQAIEHYVKHVGDDFWEGDWTREPEQYDADEEAGLAILMASAGSLLDATKYWKVRSVAHHLGFDWQEILEDRTTVRVERDPMAAYGTPVDPPERDKFGEIATYSIVTASGTRIGGFVTRQAALEAAEKLGL